MLSQVKLLVILFVIKCCAQSGLFSIINRKYGHGVLQVVRKWERKLRKLEKLIVTLNFHGFEKERN